jgi:large subunit ribosomal protein L17
LNSLAEALVSRERILTTEVRAKAIRPYVEGMITKAKQPTLAKRRVMIAALGGREKTVKKIFDVLAPRFKDRKGGYTRITKVVKKSQDGRQSALIEFV